MRNGKVLIVEDQPNFRKGLAKMIEEGNLGWKVIGEASNGKDALERLEQLKPDLVLTDIRMPIMDGIEFVGHLREKHPDMLVIILTGYKNFEYAQAAVRHGALDLLIKPCTEQDVRRVLAKALDRHYERHAQQRKQLAHQKLQMEQELRAALLGLPNAYGVVERLNAFLSTKAVWLLQMNEADLMKKNDRKSDISLLQFALSNIIEELLNESGIDAVLFLAEQHRFVIVAEQDAFGEPIREAIQTAAWQYLNVRVTVNPMGPAISSHHISEAYRHTKGISVGEGQSGAGRGDPLETESGLTWSLNQIKVRQLETRLMSAILIGQEDRLQQLMASLLEELSNQPPEELKIQAMAFSIALHRTIQNQFEWDESVKLPGIPLDMPKTDASREQVVRWASEQADHFLLLFNNWQTSKSDNVIERAVKYIEEHYAEECRLTDVADHVHLNASYFSVLFKKTTGESFTRFVIRYRMEKAALLLRNTDMKIFEIAGAVGFDEPNYFTNVFKQQFGMSPKEYRSHENERDPMNL